MKSRQKLYLKLNLMSLFFAAVSLISITLAWFAYSGLAKVSTEMDVKAWYIEFQKGSEVVSNNIVVSLTDIYPGMKTVNETVEIKNFGDSDANLSYSIVSARILDDTSDDYVVDNSTVTSEYVEDQLAHEYPFHVNINLSKNYVVSKEGTSVFNVSISWPLDSDNDNLDSVWGTKSYQFQEREKLKQLSDVNYKVRSSVKIVISVKAEQYVENDTASDMNYDLGDIVLYDVQNNKICNELSSTCLKTYVIDVNNTLKDNMVTLLPDLYNNYTNGSYDNYDSLFTTLTSTWGVNSRPLEVSDLLKIISTDVTNSLLIRDGMSDSIIGNLNYNNRMANQINKAITYNGYYSFLNEKFRFLTTSKCYWVNSNYNSDSAFALVKSSDSNSKIYSEKKINSCSIVPVISVPKTNLKNP